MNVIFLGPTVATDEARQLLEARFVPPARQGDVYRACKADPSAIGLIDGYFDGVPAVWHKEILYAMERGIHVFGAASMGALRAVELESFGMTGVGRIFEWFRDGKLEDDDEVAVRHAPAEDGFRPLSVPMVNIRATIGAAEDAGVIGRDAATALLTAAKCVPYGERSYRTAIAGAVGRAPEQELDAFSRWWKQGQVDQKRLDALNMLQTMASLGGPEGTRKVVDFHVEETEAWREARNRTNRIPSPDFPVAESDVSILEELRILGAYPAARQRAFTRALILETADTLRDRPERDEIQDAVNRFRFERGLNTPDQFSRWLAEQDLTAEGEYERFFSEQADVYRAELLFRERTVKRLSDQLRADGMFERLMKRAVLKNATLERGSVEGSRDGDVSEDGLWTWYFQSVLNVDRPPDLARCALELGFEDLPSFYRAVRREWTFRKTKGVDGLMNATQTHAVPEDPA